MKRTLLSPLTYSVLLSASLLVSCSKKNEDSAAIDSARNANVAAEAQKVAPASASAPSNEAVKLNGPLVKSSAFDNFLPTISGYTADKPKHTDFSMNGMNWSSAECNYTNDNGNVKITFFDYNYNQQLSQPLMMLRNMSVETDDEISKGESINGQPGWYKWNKKENNGEALIFINDRIIVKVDYNGGTFDGMKSVANSIDFAGVAKLAS